MNSDAAPITRLQPQSLHPQNQSLVLLLGNFSASIWGQWSVEWWRRTALVQTSVLPNESDINYHTEPLGLNFLIPVLLPGESQGRGAWLAAVYGVSQRRTRLKRLSSSSSSNMKTLRGQDILFWTPNTSYIFSYCSNKYSFENDGPSALWTDDIVKYKKCN